MFRLTQTTFVMIVAFIAGMTAWSAPASATHYAGGEITYRGGSKVGPTTRYPAVSTAIGTMLLSSSDPAGQHVPLPQVRGEVFQVDSFFDVFTEVRVGGQSFQIDSFFDITYRIRKRPDLLTQEWDMLVDEVLMSAESPRGHTFSMRLARGTRSTGGIRVTDLPDGSFHVDSFFDIWTEVSIDGGPYARANSPMRLAMNAQVPEPASMSLLAMGGVALARRRYKTKRIA